MEEYAMELGLFSFVEALMEKGPARLAFGFVFLAMILLMTYLVGRLRSKDSHAGETRPSLSVKSSIALSVVIVGVSLGVSSLAHRGCRSIEVPFSTTQYAEGYSKGAFMAVKPGDSAGDVIELLGEPLRVTDTPEVYEWHYSHTKRFPVYHDHWLRVVEIDKSTMRVVSKEMRFIWDW